MAGFTPLTQAQFRSILVNQFAASLTSNGVAIQDVPDTGPGTIMGASFDAISLLAAQQQYQDAFVQATARLATIPENADGSPNPDVDSFVAPHGYTRRDGGFATSNTFALNLNSPSSSPVTIPTGVIFQRADGLPFVFVADASQPAYNGSTGYVIPAGSLSALATATALATGIVGNTDANQTWSLYTAPGSLTAPIASITNASRVANGAPVETDAALKARFTLGQQNGKWAVATAIQSTVAGAVSGLTYSNGDHINPDGSYHGAFFTVVVNNANSPIAPSSTLLAAVRAALLPVRAYGIEYTVVAPALVTPVITGNIAVRAGYTSAIVQQAAQIAVHTYVNSLGLDPNGGTTTLSYAQLVSLVVSIAGVNPAGTSIFVKGVAGIDVVAPFGSQIVAPTLPPFTAS